LRDTLPFIKEDLEKHCSTLEGNIKESEKLEAESMTFG